MPHQEQQADADQRARPAMGMMPSAASHDDAGQRGDGDGRAIAQERQRAAPPT
ncbi:MAG: hypothetical protein H6891_06570 [Brucellaceae bacterium]|nr:hypothetical protein [Brucellaceae bacterium]